MYQLVKLLTVLTIVGPLSRKLQQIQTKGTLVKRTEKLQQRLVRRVAGQYNMTRPTFPRNLLSPFRAKQFCLRCLPLALFLVYNFILKKEPEKSSETSVNWSIRAILRLQVQ
jgi:hypothetical protein